MRGRVNLFCSAMDRFQLKLVFNVRATLRERSLSLGSTWRYQTHSLSVSRYKIPYCLRLLLRNELAPLTRSQLPVDHWLKLAGRRQTIFRQQMRQRSSCPSLKRPGGNHHRVATTPFVQALAPTNRFVLSIINGVRRLTRSQPSLASRHASRSNLSLCSIMLRPFMRWSLGCRPHLQNDAWLSTSSPDEVRLT